MPTDIAVPRAFYDDHRDRDLPTPAILRRDGSRYVISAEDPATAELLNDAEHYGHRYGPDCTTGLRRSANLTRWAIREAMELAAKGAA